MFGWLCMSPAIPMIAPGKEPPLGEYVTLPRNRWGTPEFLQKSVDVVSGFAHNRFVLGHERRPREPSVLGNARKSQNAVWFSISNR
jgi:hypothetical protein